MNQKTRSPSFLFYYSWTSLCLSFSLPSLSSMSATFLSRLNCRHFNNELSHLSAVRLLQVKLQLRPGLQIIIWTRLHVGSGRKIWRCSRHISCRWKSAPLCRRLSKVMRPPLTCVVRAANYCCTQPIIGTRTAHVSVGVHCTTLSFIALSVHTISLSKPTSFRSSLSRLCLSSAPLVLYGLFYRTCRGLTSSTVRLMFRRVCSAVSISSYKYPAHARSPVLDGQYTSRRQTSDAK